MNRYQIASHKNIKPLAYRFKPSNSVNRIVDYMKKCVADKVDFEANNIKPETLDSALIKLSKDIGFPIIVDSESTERAMRMAYGTKKIFSLKTMPNIFNVICYYDVDKRKLSDRNVVLKIIRGQV
jgi:hypothetical protein